MICPNCRAQLADGTLICTNCGYSLPPQPQYQQPAYGQPVNGQPAYGQAVNGQPAYGQAVNGQPAYGQPVNGQSAYGQPVNGQPAYGQPVNGQPVYGQPVYGQPLNTQPALRAKAPFALRLIGALGAILIVIGVFLPYAKVLGFSASLMEGDDSYIFFGIAALGLIFSLTALGIGQIIMGVIAIICQIIEWSGNDLGGIVSKGSGFYVILLGAILLIAGGITTIVVKSNLKRRMR